MEGLGSHRHHRQQQQQQQHPQQQAPDYDSGIDSVTDSSSGVGAVRPLAPTLGVAVEASRVGAASAAAAAPGAASGLESSQRRFGSPSKSAKAIGSGKYHI